MFYETEEKNNQMLFSERLKQKLHSNSGESIAETLVSVLIAALALLLLAGTMRSASNIVTRSREKLKDYYDASETMVTTTPDTEATVTITDGSASGGITISSSIKYNENDTFSDVPVVMYEPASE